MFNETRHQRFPWVFFTVLMIVLGTWVYTLFAPNYRLTSIEINGASKIDKGSVERFINNRLNTGFLGFQWRRVYYLTPVNSLARDLRSSIERLVSVNDITIIRRGRQTLVVTVSERTPNLVWETSRGDRYTVDEKGIVVERLTEDVPQGFKILNDSNNIPTDIGSKVVRPEYLSAMDTIANLLATLQITPTGYATWKVECRTVNALNVNVPDGNENTNNELTINTNSKNTNVDTLHTNVGETTNQAPCNTVELAFNDPTVVAVVQEGYEIRLDTSSDINTQIQKLSVALKERLSNKINTLQYIDVRFGNKVYYQ